MSEEIRKITWVGLMNSCNEVEPEEEEDVDLLISEAYTESDERLEAYDDRTIALGMHLDLNMSEIDDIDHEYDCRYTAQGDEYFCGNWKETNDAQIEATENYIDDCVLPDIDENIHQFLDMDKMIEYYSQDGWAHILGSYDGEGYEIEVNGETYHICRTN
jgi:hypothetical protein